MSAADIAPVPGTGSDAKAESQAAFVMLGCVFQAER